MARRWEGKQLSQSAYQPALLPAPISAQKSRLVPVSFLAGYRYAPLNAGSATGQGRGHTCRIPSPALAPAQLRTPRYAIAHLNTSKRFAPSPHPIESQLFDMHGLDQARPVSIPAWHIACNHDAITRETKTRARHTIVQLDEPASGGPGGSKGSQ